MRGLLNLLLGLLLSIFFVALYLLYVAVTVSIIGFVIYFFLVIGGIVPSVDFIPLIPYI